jgi:hypothetical protein
MAAPKPYYGTIEEAQAYLKSEGFEQMKLSAFWKCDMTGHGGEHVYATIQGKAPNGYCIVEVQDQKKSLEYGRK